MTAEALTWLRARSERVIETSCAFVFLAGDLAWKVKKPVDLGFLDFSTLEKRHWALERELRFNRRTAPDIYRALRAITREGGGALAFDGAGETVEWALELRRFDDDAVLSNHPDWVNGELAEALGRAIARSHIDAPPTPEGGGAEAMRYTTAVNADHLRALKAPLGEETVERLLADTEAALAAQAPLLERRRIAGFARRCHGDLHLGNILLEQGRPVLFDCIEFNDRLSLIDTQYDLAFPVMDLGFRGRAEAANRLLNGYMDEAARGFGPDLWAGLAALPLMLSVRAAVRAHVSGAVGDPAAARLYLAAAQSHLAPTAPHLIAVGGLSGSGKTTFARALAPKLAGAPGAVVLRSDEIRKRLWRAAPLDRLPPEAYAQDQTPRVYQQMITTARTLLGAQRSVVLDATFLAKSERDQAETLAREAKVRFTGIWLEGKAELLKARIAARRGDASDADASVLARQLSRDLGPIAWRCVAAGSDFAAETDRLAG